MSRFFTRYRTRSTHARVAPKIPHTCHQITRAFTYTCMCCACILLTGRFQCERARAWKNHVRTFTRPHAHTFLVHIRPLCLPIVACSTELYIHVVCQRSAHSEFSTNPYCSRLGARASHCAPTTLFTLIFGFNFWSKYYMSSSYGECNIIFANCIPWRGVAW